MLLGNRDKTVDIERFNKSAIASLQLWFSLCEEENWQIAKVREFAILQAWLTQDYKQAMYDLGKNDIASELWWPRNQAPDICATCYRFYGYTLGGRVREGCPECEDDGSRPTFYMYSLRDYLYVNSAHCEYLFARALYGWSKSRPRRRQRTAKYLADNNLYITEPNTEVYGSKMEQERQVTG